MEIFAILASELTAAAVILQYWTQALQSWHWAVIIIVPIFIMQLIHVRVYGIYHESILGVEAWFNVNLQVNPSIGSL